MILDLLSKSARFFISKKLSFFHLNTILVLRYSLLKKNIFKKWMFFVVVVGLWSQLADKLTIHSIHVAGFYI